jgi:hypothetical protein
VEAVDGYRFAPADLAVGARLPGISAFMRVKNGADFIEAAIRSHLPHVDEIVVVHNQCTDGTPDILARLGAEFGPERLPVFHYLPKVFPPGSEGHAREPADSPASFVNMSNLALARTRHRIVTKLDDDHLAMGARLAPLTQRIRAAGYRLAPVLCISGLNLSRDENGKEGVLKVEPFTGNGDIGFFEVTPRTHFIHHPRFEDFHYDGKRRLFADFGYWHMKYLKSGYGFANRDIDAGNPRFARKREAFLANRGVEMIAELRARAPRGLALRRLITPTRKARLKIERWQRLLGGGPTDAEVAAVFQNIGTR